MQEEEEEEAGPPRAQLLPFLGDAKRCGAEDKKTIYYDTFLSSRNRPKFLECSREFFFIFQARHIYVLEMSLAAWLHCVFILLGLMAIVAKGLPTTKQTAIERPAILRKSQPTIGEPTASRWPTLAEVITNAGNAIKPSASLLDMLQSEEEKRKIIMSDDDVVTLVAASAPTDATTQKITANVIDVAQLGITDFGLWNEDNIKLDFMTGRTKAFFFFFQNENVRLEVVPGK